MIVLILGFTGQAVFAIRIIVQWLYSEKMKRSVIPVGFWYLSPGGALCCWSMLYCVMTLYSFWGRAPDLSSIYAIFV